MLMRVALCMGMCALGAFGQEVTIDPADVETFVDGQMEAHMEAHHIPGAQIAIVYQGEVILKKGYGYADIESETKVDPDTSLFMIGSVSKPFTWTAGMQLVEEGALDLNADLSTYVPDVAIPKRYGKPMTFLDLMNHTPGLEDRGLHLFARSHEEVLPLGEMFAKEPLPMQVRAPGGHASYSNHGSALAGYVVEKLRGKPWEDCIEDHILEPLGMEHTNVRQPAVEEMPEGLATGYEMKQGKYEAKDYEYIPLAPAGCISSTAGDMARFMLMHLNLGEYEGAQILKTETAEAMHAQSHSHDPRVTGMAHGLIESERNGIRFIGHGGDTLYFHSMMEMAPEIDFGLFVTYNAIGGTQAREPLLNAILDRYFPDESAPFAEVTEESKKRSKRAAGQYYVTRRNFSTLESITAFASPFAIQALQNGNLFVAGDPGTQFQEVQPFVYRDVNGDATIVFAEEDGKVSNMYMQNLSIMVFERAGIFTSPTANSILLYGSMLILALSIPLVLIGSYVAWLTKEKPPVPVYVRYGTLLAAVIAIGYVVQLLILLSGGTEIVFGLPPIVDILVRVPWAILVLTVVVAVSVIVAWVRRSWPLLPRVYYTAAAFAGAGFLWFLYNWHLWDTSLS